MPELPLDDMPAGIAHYRDVLGFQINYQQDDRSRSASRSSERRSSVLARRMSLPGHCLATMS
jgi:hypothetical protein